MLSVTIDADSVDGSSHAAGAEETPRPQNQRQASGQDPGIRVLRDAKLFSTDVFWNPSCAPFAVV